VLPLDLEPKTVQDIFVFLNKVLVWHPSSPDKKRGTPLAVLP